MNQSLRTCSCISCKLILVCQPEVQPSAACHHFSTSASMNTPVPCNAALCGAVHALCHSSHRAVVRRQQSHPRCRHLRRLNVACRSKTLSTAGFRQRCRDCGWTSGYCGQLVAYRCGYSYANAGKRQCICTGQSTRMRNAGYICAVCWACQVQMCAAGHELCCNLQCKVFLTGKSAWHCVVCVVPPVVEELEAMQNGTFWHVLHVSAQLAHCAVTVVLDLSQQCAYCAPCCAPLAAATQETKAEPPSPSGRPKIAARPISLATTTTRCAQAHAAEPFSTGWTSIRRVQMHSLRHHLPQLFMFCA